jgi:hypothetical protein
VRALKNSDILVGAEPTKDMPPKSPAQVINFPLKEKLRFYLFVSAFSIVGKKACLPPQTEISELILRSYRALELSDEIERRN